MAENNEKIIAEKIKELLEKMGFVCEIETEKNDEDSTIFNIKTEESSFLIGQYGINLQALQHVVRLLAKKLIDERINFTIDVNSYRQEKNTSLEKIAREAAQQALQEKREISLRPMTPYERRIVHMELAKNNQVRTESVGEGEQRRISVRPVSL